MLYFLINEFVISAVTRNLKLFSDFKRCEMVKIGQSGAKGKRVGTKPRSNLKEKQWLSETENGEPGHQNMFVH
jgi:hypothetical protein